MWVKPDTSDIDPECRFEKSFFFQSTDFAVDLKRFSAESGLISANRHCTAVIDAIRIYSILPSCLRGHS